MKLPLLGGIALTILLFWLGLTELAIINIILLVFQIVGGLIFDMEPRDFMFVSALIVVVIVLVLQFVFGINMF